MDGRPGYGEEMGHQVCSLSLSLPPPYRDIRHSPPPPRRSTPYERCRRGSPRLFPSPDLSFGYDIPGGCDRDMDPPPRRSTPYRRCRRGSPRPFPPPDRRFGNNYPGGYDRDMGGRPGCGEERPRGGGYQGASLPTDGDSGRGGFVYSSNPMGTERGPSANTSPYKSGQTSHPNSDDEANAGANGRQHGGMQAKDFDASSAAPKAHRVNAESIILSEVLPTSLENVGSALFRNEFDEVLAKLVIASTGLCSYLAKLVISCLHVNAESKILAEVLPMALESSASVQVNAENKDGAEVLQTALESSSSLRTNGTHAQVGQPESFSEIIVSIFDLCLGALTDNPDQVVQAASEAAGRNFSLGEILKFKVPFLFYITITKSVLVSVFSYYSWTTTLSKREKRTCTVLALLAVGFVLLHVYYLLSVSPGFTVMMLPCGWWILSVIGGIDFLCVGLLLEYNRRMRRPVAASNC